MDPATLHASSTAALHHRYPFLGLARVHHTNKRAQPMTFEDKPFLVPLYSILPQLAEAVFCKGVQTGLSELLIAYILYQAGWNDRICAYVLPQYKTSERFVGDRIDTVLLRTPAYQARLPGGAMGLVDGKGKGNLKRKRFGRRGSLLFLGSNTESDFVEFSCDIAVVDEWDNCDLKNVAQIKDRTREADNPQVFKVSNPRIPGRGITKLWEEGNRSRWYHQCQRCGERQYLDWFKHIVRKDSSGNYVPRDVERAHNDNLGDLRPVCQRCKKPWDRVAKGGVWIAEEPSRRVASFHISRMDVLASRKNPQPIRAGYAEFIAALTDTNAMITFWAGFLGWAYEAPGSSVTQDIIDNASRDQPLMDYTGGDYLADASVVMGVDVGSVLNVKISKVGLTEDERHPYRRETLWTGAVVDFDDLIMLQERYHVDILVIDADPETRKCKELREHFVENGECRVYLARFFPTPRVGSSAFGMKIDYRQGLIQCDRTQVFDTTLDDLTHGRNLLPADIDTVIHFSQQMQAPKRKVNDQGRAIWDEGSAADHYRLADVYERMALEVHAKSGTFHD